MVINGIDLLLQTPIRSMLTEKHREHGVSHGLTEVGYDIRLKQRIRFNTATGGGSIWEPNEPMPKSFKGRFVLASTIDEFVMPDNLVGVVHDKSSWARKGLSVFNTVIEPGWRGFLTLELVYHGHEEVVIPAGSGIAQVIFHQISASAVYDGKYQDQADRPVEAIHA